MIMTAPDAFISDEGERIVHHPVMLGEVLAALQIEPNGTYVDATCGPGGHAEAIASRLSQDGRLIVIDRDHNILNEAQRRLKPYPCRIEFIHDNFRNLKTQLRRIGGHAVNGVLFDCGVSMVQLRLSERGFSFRKEGPLDMRMDQQDSLTAAAIVNSWTEKDLTRIFMEYGQERYARRIAQRIIRERQHTPILTTKQLADLVLRAMGPSGRCQRVHPATRVFQALRIAVNDELGALDEGLSAARESLTPGGRLVVISFHSLEDRLVKSKFKEWSLHGTGRIVTRKPLRPTADEVSRNPAARSARLRIWQKGGGARDLISDSQQGV